MSEFLLRSEILLGKEKIDSLKKSTITIFGLGGVGGTAYECLLRSGVGSFNIIDCDVVQESNLNRQILFSNSDIGKEKSEVAYLRGKAINHEANIAYHSFRVNEETLTEHDFSSSSFLIDAVDDIKAKVAIIKYGLDHSIPFIVSLGMANRLDPRMVMERRLDKTEYDPLAKKLRETLRKEGIDLKKVNCVFSAEKPLTKGKIPASMMMVPSSAGLLLAHIAIREITKKYDNFVFLA